MFTVGIYQSAAFQEISSWGEYGEMVNSEIALQMINILSGLVFLIDGIVLVADRDSRALHDKIAGTCVIMVK